MKKFFIMLFFTLFITGYSAKTYAVSDEDMLMGFCSTFMPGLSYEKPVEICETHGNKRICRIGYNPATVKQCRKMLEQMGMLKPGESPQALFKHLNNNSNSPDPQKMKNVLNGFYGF